MISLITIVKDEVHRLRNMLQGVLGIVDEVVLVDQGSQDGTVASVLGLVDVIVRDRPHGYSELSIQTAVRHASKPWILQLDADEALDPHFVAQLPELLKMPEISGVRMPRQNMVDGAARINDPGNPDDGQLRLYKREDIVEYPTTIHRCVKLKSKVHRLDYRCIIHAKSAEEVEADQGRYAKILTGQDGRKPEWADTSKLNDQQLAMLTCGRALAEYEPEPAIADMLRLDPKKPLRILDFGAGMLRNTVGLAEASPAWRVVAFDTPDMLKRGRAIFAQRLEKLRGRVSYVTSRPELANEKFDVVYASLVFQHMDEPHLRRALREIWEASPFLAVGGRRTLDCMKRSVWAIVQDYYTLIEVTAWDHNGPPSARDLNAGDPNDHMTAVFKRRA